MKHHSLFFADESQQSQLSSTSISHYNPIRKKKHKHKSSPEKKKPIQPLSIPRVPIAGEATADSNSVSCAVGTVMCELIRATEQSKASIGGEGFSFGERRQRSVNGANPNCEDLATSAIDDNYGKEYDSLVVENHRNDSSGSAAEYLELKSLVAEEEDSNVHKSPVTYFLGQVYNGNALRSTTTLGNEKERERVYDTIFRLPWRCELLIDVGFFVCFNSFLSLLTIMPMRITMTICELLKTRKFKRLSTMELSDFGCFLILSCGVTLLQQTDISLIYHMIRGQGTIKLYVIYNVLEIFDKLFLSFNGDVLQTLFHSADGLARCPPERMRFWIWRFISDQIIAVATSIVHSFILLVQAITLSTCIAAQKNALLALLVSNNFTEIKSYVFKGYNKDNIRSLVYSDSIERFHISAFILFVLAQNILEAEGPWFKSFLTNILLVYLSEMVIDIIKHSFIAKFNNIKPVAYSEFLEVLSKQTLNMQIEDVKKNLTFVPFAPACVVIRVLTPVYAANLPISPLPWRFFWIMLFSAISYIMLTSLKVLIGMGLQKHATWYVKRCQRRRHHLHED